MDYNLYNELQAKQHDLDVSVRMLRETGTALADAERDYKIRLRAESLALRDSGMPVTLIQLTVYGIEEVAELRHRRDKAEVVYRANMDAINAIKLEMKIIENQIAREWSTPPSSY